MVIAMTVAHHVRFKKGFAVQIKEEECRALYNRCHPYSLNLAEGDTMNDCPILKHTMVDHTDRLTKKCDFKF